MLICECMRAIRLVVSSLSIKLLMLMEMCSNLAFWKHLFSGSHLLKFVIFINRIALFIHGMSLFYNDVLKIPLSHYLNHFIARNSFYIIQSYVNHDDFAAGNF